MRFSESKCRVLHFSWDNLRYIYRLEEKLIESSSAEFFILDVSLQPRKPTVSSVCIKRGVAAG